MPTDPTENANHSPELRSEFAGDPDMQEILELFVQEMPSRIRDLRSYWENRELEKVGRLAHQLKGAGGGYGFNIISEAAAQLEKSITALAGAPTETTLNQMKAQVDTLVDLCNRVSAR